VSILAAGISEVYAQKEGSCSEEYQTTIVVQQEDTRHEATKNRSMKLFHFLPRLPQRTQKHISPAVLIRTTVDVIDGFIFAQRVRYLFGLADSLASCRCVIR
jgi:hypothetical protein